MNRFITLGSMLAFGVAVAACNTPDSSSTVQRDVAKADPDRTKDVADARRDGAEAVQRQQTDVNAAARDVTDAETKRDYEVAIAKADGDYQVANQACEALSGNSQSACKDEAESTRKADKARAQQLNPKN
jgi:hypothetical protein